MSMQPPQFDYQPYPVIPVSNKPTSVLVMAILGIIFGGLTTLCMPFAIIPYVVDFGVPNPMLDVLKSDPVLKAWTLVSTVEAFLMGVLLLSSSIGSLTMKRWARVGMVIYGAVSAILGIAGHVANFVWIRPRMLAVQNSAGIPNPAWADILGIAMGFLGLAFSVIIWVVFTRPHVKQAFDQAEAVAV